MSDQSNPVSSDDSATIRCLYVEDQELDSKIFRRLARESRKGITTKHVITIGEAREQMNRNRFDLVFLDHNLPDGLGSDFAVEIVESGTMEWDNVIVLTGGFT